MPWLRAVAVLLILGAGFASAASAEVAPIVDGVPFLIRFGGAVRGLKPGAPVEVLGIRIGEVTSVGVDYAPDSNGFVAPVGIVLQPSLFPAAGGHPRTAPPKRIRKGTPSAIGATCALAADAKPAPRISKTATARTRGANDRSGPICRLPLYPHFLADPTSRTTPVG